MPQNQQYQQVYGAMHGTQQAQPYGQRRRQYPYGGGAPYGQGHAVHQQQLPPMYEVVDYYKENGRLSTVNGEKQIEEVSDALMRAIAQPARA